MNRRELTARAMCEAQSGVYMADEQVREVEGTK